MPCMKPPVGWWCSRDAGHEGPCAARRREYKIYLTTSKRRIPVDRFYPRNRVPCPDCMSYWDDEPHECNQ